MKILLISDNRYPDGDAGAVRERVLAQMLIKQGNEVYRVGRFCSTEKILEGVVCFPVADKGKVRNGNLKNLLLFNLHIKKIITEKDNDIHFDAFLLTGLKARLVDWIKKYAVDRNIKLVYNSVEFYSENQFKYGKLSRHFKTNRKIAQKIIDQNFSVIGISSFLKNIFEQRNIKAVRIPFVLFSREMKYSNIQNERVEIAYIGRPGKGKDYLKDFVEELGKLNADELQKIHLTIVGVTKKELIDNFSIREDLIDYLGDAFSPMGLLPRQKAMEILSSMDFTVLYRSDTAVYAKAGFPTKVTESLMCGIPVITNLTSDLSLYIKDGENGLVIDNREKISDCYRRAINMPKENLNRMKISARKTAEFYLDANCYANEIKEIFA